MGQYSGLRGGFRPADITRRLDELISVARFKKSRRSHELERGARWAFMNTVYLVVASGLFYSAIQFSLETMFPGKFHHTRIPVGEIITFCKQAIPMPKPSSGEPTSSEMAEPAATSEKKDAKAKPTAEKAGKPEAKARAKRKVRGKAKPRSKKSKRARKKSTSK